jgi:hypothetical protein
MMGQAPPIFLMDLRTFSNYLLGTGNQRDREDCLCSHFIKILWPVIKILWPVGAMGEPPIGSGLPALSGAGTLY